MWSGDSYEHFGSMTWCVCKAGDNHKYSANNKGPQINNARTQNFLRDQQKHSATLERTLRVEEQRGSERQQVGSDPVGGRSRVPCVAGAPRGLRLTHTHTLNSSHQSMRAGICKRTQDHHRSYILQGSLNSKESGTQSIQ